MTVLVVNHDLSVALGDAFRIITVLELFVVLGLSCAILSLYIVGNLHIRRVDPHVQGMLPRYVITMATSYALLVAFGIAEIQGFYGSPLTWRTPIGFLAANFGVYAAVNLLLFENARLDLRDERIHLEGSPE